MTPSETRVTAADGARLFVRAFGEEVSASRNTLVVVHGAMEHGGRYAQFAREFAARGLRVLVPDLRGHGLSDGVRCHVDRFSQYVDDLGLLADAFSLDPARTAVLGHSLGGLIAIRFAQTNAKRLKALVATAPLLGVAVPIPAYVLWLGRCLSHVAPQTRFRDRVPPEWATRNPEILAQRAADRLIITSVTARWYMEALAAITQAHQSARDFRIPALVLQGTADRVTDIAAAKRWANAANAAAAAPVALRFLDGQFHELLFEPERLETMQLVFQWLETRFSGG